MGSSGKIITVTDIPDGLIVNADVNTAAAIAHTKLAHVGANAVLRSNGTANVAGQVATTDIAPAAVTQANQTILGAGATTASGAAGPITGATVSLTTTGGLVLLLASGNVYHSGAGQQIVLEFGVDAVGQGANWAIVAPGASYFVPLTMAQFVQPSAGLHAFTVRWLTSAATATVNGLVVSAIELKR